MNLDGWTFGLQAVNFLILVWVLQKFLYRPVLAVIERRRRESERAFAEAQEAKRSAEREAGTFQARTEALVRERHAMIQETRARLEEERARVIESARAEADRLIAKAADDIADEREEVLAGLLVRASDLAVAIAGALLRKMASRPLEEAFLEPLCRKLAEMPERERLRLRGSGDAASTVTVETAMPLEETTREAWRQRLGLHLGPGTVIGFAHDAGLIAGARLRFPAATLEANWQDALDEARKEMMSDGAAG